MEILVLLTVLGTVLHETTAGSHSLKYFYTGSSGVPDFPEFVAVGYIDDVQMEHYDSNTRRAEPRQDWMDKTAIDDPKYWKRNTDIFMSHQHTLKNNVDILKLRFNQTGGVHLFQVMYGCEWDDQTGPGRAFRQFGYDGEDFISFDLQTETWITSSPQAVITKRKLDNNKDHLASLKNYLTNECPKWVKKYVNYGRSSLMRTDLPSVSFLQKTSSSPITCHATGFYPNNAMMFWRKDGEELQEHLGFGEILPNPDGSFQMSVDLKPPESSADWGRYECVFQLSGVKEDQVYRLEKKEILTNKEILTIKEILTNEGNQTPMIIGIMAAVVLLSLTLIAVIFMMKKRNDKRPLSPVNNPVVEQEKML